MKTFLKALLAASMLMPVAAQAQDMGERGPGRRGGGEWRAPAGGPGAPGPQRSAEVGVDAQIRTERPQWRGEGRDGGQWRGERPDRPQQPGPDRRPDWQRPDRPDRPPAIGDDGRRGNDQRREWDQRREPDLNGNRAWDRQPQARRDWNRAGDDRRWDERRDRVQDRGGWDQDRNERGRVQQRNAWDQRSAWGQRNTWDRRNAWDRQWRSDSRYDWTRYRALNRGAYRLPRYYAPSGWGYGYRRFGVGVSLSPILFAQTYWIDDPFAYRLPEAYGPYRWVRYYDDALLVDIRSGQVVDTVYDIFF